MGLRSSLATTALNVGRSIGNALGCEVAVDVSGHSIETKMVVPSNDGERAWDDSLYVKGNLFVDGYANPIKPVVEDNQGLENKDTVDVEEAEVVEEEDRHVDLMSSARYQMFMIQNLVSELLNPNERLTKIMYAILGIAGLQLISVVIMFAIASGVGVF